MVTVSSGAAISVLTPVSSATRQISTEARSCGPVGDEAATAGSVPTSSTALPVMVSGGGASGGPWLDKYSNTNDLGYARSVTSNGPAGSTTHIQGPFWPSRQGHVHRSKQGPMSTMQDVIRHCRRTATLLAVVLGVVAMTGCTGEGEKLPPSSAITSSHPNPTAVPPPRPRATCTSGVISVKSMYRHGAITRRSQVIRYVCSSTWETPRAMGCELPSTRTPPQCGSAFWKGLYPMHHPNAPPWQ